MEVRLRAVKCPFCGNDDLKLKHRKIQNGRVLISVHCDVEHRGCGANGPYEITALDAIRAWNRREA